MQDQLIKSLSTVSIQINYKTLQRPFDQRKSSQSIFLIEDRKIIDIMVKNRKLMNIARERDMEMDITSLTRLISG